MLLTFEGIDGSGKTTQARRLVERLRGAGREVLYVREPGGTPLAERVRTLLLDPELAIAPFAELLLFSAARAQLVEEAVRPALEAGHVVVCDRFYDSTTAYQGAGRGVAEPDWLAAFHQHVTGGLVPDRTYLVEVPLEVARARRADAGRADDRMEQAGSSFFERVRDAYEGLAEADDRFLRLDGTRSIEALHEAVWEDAGALLAHSSRAL